MTPTELADALDTLALERPASIREQQTLRSASHALRRLGRVEAEIEARDHVQSECDALNGNECTCGMDALRAALRAE